MQLYEGSSIDPIVSGVRNDNEHIECIDMAVASSITLFGGGSSSGDWMFQLEVQK